MATPRVPVGCSKRGFVPSLSDPLGCTGTIVVVIIVVLALAAAAMFQLKLGPFASAGANQNLLSGGASKIGEEGTICKLRAPILMMSTSIFYHVSIIMPG